MPGRPGARRRSAPATHRHRLGFVGVTAGQRLDRPTAPPAAASPPAPPDAVTAAPALLEGITVLEFATWIATPMATELLAELGARVIKVEPLEADPMRAYGSTGWKFVQGKESLVVDLKQAEGREIVQCLAERADVWPTTTDPVCPSDSGSTMRRSGPATPG